MGHARLLLAVAATARGAASSGGVATADQSGAVAMVRAAWSGGVTTASPSGRNVLHVIVDDLRSELGCYSPGHPIQTPNIDALAARSTRFTRAYAQQALCNPSRASFLTGRRPDTTGVYNIDDDFRKFHPRGYTTLPGALKDAGLRSLGAGKTFHNHFGSLYDGARSWSREALPSPRPRRSLSDDPSPRRRRDSSPFDNAPSRPRRYRNPCYTQGVQCVPCHDRSFKSNVTNDWCEIEALDDRFTIDVAIDLYEGWNASAAPFYLAVGLHKPHLPWQAEKKFFDLYFRRAELSEDGSRRRRGRDVDIQWRRVAATPRPRRGYSVETSRDASGTPKTTLSSRSTSARRWACRGWRGPTRTARAPGRR